MERSFVHSFRWSFGVNFYLAVVPPSHIFNGADGNKLFFCVLILFVKDDELVNAYEF